MRAEKMVVATGSRPASFSHFSNRPRIFLADMLKFLPADHLLVVGGGAVGVEMAAIFRELGSQVTLVEAMDRLLPHEDPEMADYLRAFSRDARSRSTVTCR